MSSRGYQQANRGNKYRHNLPSGSRRSRRNEGARHRRPDRGAFTRRTLRRLSNDSPSTSRMRNKALMNVAADSDSNSISSDDNGGTHVPDHVWVGEYLDEDDDADDDEKNILPLTYDAAVNQMVHKKALSKATKAVRDLINPVFLPENLAKSSLSAPMDFDPKLKVERNIRSSELMPPPMPRLGEVSSLSDEGIALKRYHKLYSAIVDSIEYQAELEKQHNRLLKQTQVVSMPAEVYDYGHGEKASSSRERKEWDKSSEDLPYGISKRHREVLSTASSILGKRRQQQGSLLESGENPAATKYREIVKAFNSLGEASLRDTSTKSSSSNRRLAIPSDRMPSEELSETGRARDAKSVRPSSPSLLSMAKPFTFQELCELQKFLSRPTPSIPVVEDNDENFIPVRTSQSASNQEAYPIRVLTGRRGSAAKEEEGDLPRLATSKSSEGRQPVAQVTPLRIKPILKKARKDTDASPISSTSHFPGARMHFPQSSTYIGSFNDTRKVLLDADKELESRSTNELQDRPLLLVRNASLRGDKERFSSLRRKTSNSHDISGEVTESHFPFNTGRDDAGRKSDTDDEADKKRFDRLFARSRSPPSKGRRYIRSRSHSGSRPPSYEPSQSSSPGSRRRQRKKRDILSPHRHTATKKRQSVSPPHRLVVPPGRSAGHGDTASYFRDDDKKEKLRRTRHILKDSPGRRGPATGIRNEFVLGEEGSYFRSRTRPSLKEGDHGRKRQDSPSLRGRILDHQEGTSLQRHSPYRKARFSPKADRRSRSTHDDNPKLDLFQIAFPTDGGRKIISRKHDHVVSHEHKGAGSKHKSDSVTSDQPRSERVFDLKSRHREGSLENRRQTLEAVHHGRSVIKDSTRYPSRSDARRGPAKRPPSKSRSAQSPELHPLKRDRSSPSSVWIHKAEAQPSDREVVTTRRYQHEEMDSILQDEELPKLLDIEITPLPGLMDVDISAKPEVKLKDERKFASRSSNVDPTSPTDSKVLFEERQKKKVITNPRGKIILKRKDAEASEVNEDKDSLLPQGKAGPVYEANALKVQIKGDVSITKPRAVNSKPNSKKDVILSEKKASEAEKKSVLKTQTKTSAVSVEHKQNTLRRKVEAPKKQKDDENSEATIEKGVFLKESKASQAKKDDAVKTETEASAVNVEAKQNPHSKKVEASKKPKLPVTSKAQSNDAEATSHKGNLTETQLNIEYLPAKEWLDIYKAWFECTMQPVLQNNDQAKELGLHDPVYFLQSVTKGNRRSLSFVPRGKAAKEILKFIAQNKKSSNGAKTSSKGANATAIDNTSKCVAPSNTAVQPADNAPTATGSSLKSTEPADDGGNEFFVIDRKPSSAFLRGATKKSSQDAEDKQEDVTPPSRASDENRSMERDAEDEDNAPRSSNSNQIPSPIELGTEDDAEPNKSTPAANDASTINYLETPQSSSVTPDHSGQAMKPSTKPKGAMKPPIKPRIATEESKIIPAIGQGSVKTTVSKEVVDSASQKLISQRSKAATKESRSWQDALVFPEDDDPLHPVKDMENISSSSTDNPDPSDLKNSLNESSTEHEDESSPTPSTSQQKNKTPSAPEKKKVAGEILPQPGKNTRKRKTNAATRSHVKEVVQSTDTSTSVTDEEPVEVSEALPTETISESQESQQELELVLNSTISLTIPTDTTDTDLSQSSDNRKESTERRPVSRRDSSEKSAVSSRRSSNRRRRQANSPSKVKSDYLPQHDSPSKAQEEFFADTPTEPELTSIQKRLLPDFKRQVELSALKTLNILYKIENYKKYKIINAADATLRMFNERGQNKSAEFTLDHAVYYIWCAFQEPAKDAQDDVKRQIRKIYRKEPCFDVSLHAFFEFQVTVFDLCRRNLKRNVRYASQKQSDIKYIRVESQYAFPQFDGQSCILMKLWIWRERMYTISRKDSFRKPNARLKHFPEVDHKPMEERVAMWLKDVLYGMIFDKSDKFSCELFHEVKRQLMKRKAHATTLEAVALIVRAWSRNHYYSIKDDLLPITKEEVSESEGTDKDELMVVDEVYSDESDSDANTEDLDIEEDLTGVQIDLF